MKSEQNMTLNEYKEKLDSLTEEELKKFQKDLGGFESKSSEECVKSFAYNKKMEDIICYYLGLKTEAEKIVEASLKSAKSAIIATVCSLFTLILFGLSIYMNFISK